MPILLLNTRTSCYLHFTNENNPVCDSIVSQDLQPFRDAGQYFGLWYLGVLFTNQANLCLSEGWSLVVRLALNP